MTASLAEGHQERFNTLFSWVVNKKRAIRESNGIRHSIARKNLYEVHKSGVAPVTVRNGILSPSLTKPSPVSGVVGRSHA